MITIATPVEVAPTLVRAIEWEGVGREWTNQFVLHRGGGEDDGDLIMLVRMNILRRRYEHRDRGFYLPV